MTVTMRTRSTNPNVIPTVEVPEQPSQQPIPQTQEMPPQPTQNNAPSLDGGTVQQPQVNDDEDYF